MRIYKSNAGTQLKYERTYECDIAAIYWLSMLIFPWAVRLLPYECNGENPEGG